MIKSNLILVYPRFLMSFILCFFIMYGQSQSIGINNDSSSPHPSSILDVKSSTKGLLIPRMSSYNRTQILNPADGLLVFDTDENAFLFFDNNAWHSFSGGSSISDNDANTIIDLEKTPNDDKIRFSIEGSEVMVISNNDSGEAQIDLSSNNNNTFIGRNAGRDNLPNGNDGIQNIFLGNYSGQNNETGSKNAFFGQSSGNRNVSGSNNVALGLNSLYYNESGSNNVAIGAFAGFGSSGNSKSSSVFIGYSAGYFEQNNNRLYIDNSNTNNPLIYGEFENNLLRVNGTLNINNEYSLPLADGETNQVLQTNGYGFLSWVDGGSSGGGGAFENAGSLTRQSSNYGNDFLFGSASLPANGSNTTDRIILFDESKAAFRAGYINSTTNWSPDSIGLYSFAVNHNNSASGSTTMAWGRDNVASGDYATGFGLFSKAIGRASLAGGHYCNAYSFGEIALGLYPTSYTAQNSNSYNVNDRLFVLGNGTSPTATNDALTVWKDGQVSIGLSTPDSRLHINSVTGENPFRVQVNGSTKFYIDDNGGISNFFVIPNNAIELKNSTANIEGRGLANAWNTYSDQRIKSSIAPISYGLQEVLQLKPKKYLHHSSEYDETGIVRFMGSETSEEIGFIAQEVYEIIPEAVSKPENENESLWSMDYTRLIPVLIQSIQDQQKIIEDLQNQINALNEQVQKNGQE